jgi:hypothetical protein
MTDVSKVFWDAAKNHKFLYQHCDQCGENIFYPKKICPVCFSADLKWVEASGKGKIYSHTLCISNVAPGFEDDAPYIVATVDLEEGVRLMSNIVDCDYEDIKCDMPVELVFEDVTQDISLPKFKLLGQAK